MPIEPKKSTKSEGRPPKASSKGKESSRLPPFEDDDDEAEVDLSNWVKSMHAFLAQSLVMYLTKTNLTPENQEILKQVDAEYQDKLDRGVYREHAKIDAWNKILERFKYSYNLSF